MQPDRQSNYRQINPNPNLEGGQNPNYGYQNQPNQAYGQQPVQENQQNFYHESNYPVDGSQGNPVAVPMNQQAVQVNQIPLEYSQNEVPIVDDHQIDDIPEMEIVSWQAKDSQDHHYGVGWYVGFSLVSLSILALGILVFKDWFFAVLTVVMSVAVIVHITRPSRMVNYRLTAKGLYVNDRLYDYADFKAFGLIQEGQEYSILMIPVKRFSPGVSVYFPVEHGEKIVDILGARLPMEKMNPSIIDKIIRKARL